MENKRHHADVSEWWDSVRDSELWSGAIVGLEWGELWEDAQKGLIEIHEKLNQQNR